VTRSLPWLLTLLAASCTSTTTIPGPPDSGDRIHLSVVDAGTSRGVRVEYDVAADVEDTARAILTVEARPETSELVAAARIVRRNPSSGEILLRFHPALNVPGEAVYRYRADEASDDGYSYRFRITPAREGGVRWVVQGSYTVNATDGGCRVTYEFTSTHAALRRDHLMRLIRQDSTEIAERAESS